MRAWLYDKLIVSMTAVWYSTVLQELPEQTTLLDIGIGTGGALLANRELVKKKNLKVLGIDIDRGYLRSCQQKIRLSQMEPWIEAKEQSIYTFETGTFDAIYFSGSFMLLPDPQAALSQAKKRLNPGGKIYFTQTFDTERTPFWEIFKPLLHWITTIRFGNVTYEDEFPPMLASEGLTIVEERLLRTQKTRKMKLIIAESVS